jgi:lipopolysaccharide export system permease protein
VFWGIIHRTILIDLFKVFALALVVLTGLILLAGIISEAMKNGLGPVQILTAIPLLLPSMLPYTVPTTTLFATCIVYGRLSADNEILALKAAGIHIVHVVWPAVVLGAFATAFTMFLSLDAIPYTHFLLRTQVVGDTEELMYTLLRKDGYIKHPKINYEIYVKHIQGRKLHDAQFMRKSADGKHFDTIARAKEAELFVDLMHQRIHIDMRQCHITHGNNVLYVESRIWPVELPRDFNSSAVKTRATDMTWGELSEYEDKLYQEKGQLSGQIDAHQMAINQGRAPPHFEEHVRLLIEERKSRDSQLFGIHSEFHMRPAFALGCMCFALLGCPIGIWFSKSDYLSAFITCFLPIVIIYYPLMFCTINMARSGKIPAWLAIYDADAMLLIVGVVLFRRLVRR